jgi:hypothetical protein
MEATTSQTPCDPLAAESFETDWDDAKPLLWRSALCMLLGLIAMELNDFEVPPIVPEFIREDFFPATAGALISLSLMYIGHWSFLPAFRIDGCGVTIRKRNWPSQTIAWDEVERIRVHGISKGLWFEIFGDKYSIVLIGPRRKLFRKKAIVDTSKFDNMPRVRRFIFAHVSPHVLNEAGIQDPVKPGASVRR